MVLLSCLIDGLAFAQSTPVPTTPAPFGTPDANSPAARNQAKIIRTLHRLEKKFGRDAVLLQGYALGLTIRKGAILEAEAALPGYEERKGEKFLIIRLATGLVLNDNEVGAIQRPMRMWTDIIEPTMRQLKTLEVEADGVLFDLTWAHKSYTDVFDLRDHLKDGQGERQSGKYYLHSSDILALLSEKITSQELVDRSVILVDGSETRLVLEATPVPSVAQPPTPSGS